MKKQIEVVAAVIENEGEILCMQRNESKHDYISYKWEFPGGKIEENESMKQALARELKEEMDYEVEIKEKLIKVVHEYPDFVLTMNAFYCVANSKKFELKEHVDFKWLEKSELRELDWAGADVPIVDEIINVLAN